MDCGPDAAESGANKERHCHNCHEDLQRVIRLRKRQKAEAPIPRWLEPSPDLLAFLHLRGLRVQPPAVLALHLSNLQEVAIDKFTTALPVAQCRDLYAVLQKGAPKSQELLGTLAGKHTMMWAPLLRQRVVSTPPLIHLSVLRSY